VSFLLCPALDGGQALLVSYVTSAGDCLGRKYVLAKRNTSMKRNDSADAIMARCMVMCMMAVFVLTKCAFAASDADVSAKKTDSVQADRLSELVQRCKNLASSMTNECTRTPKYSICLLRPPLTAIICNGRKVAEKYILEYNALRADVEKTSVPTRCQDAKNSLLSQIDMMLSELRKIHEMRIEDMVGKILDKLEADGKDEDVERGWSPLALSLVPACEFPNREKDVYGIRLNLVGGSHHDIAGLDVGGIFNYASNCLHGVQAAGLVSYSREINGLQFAGLLDGACLATGMQGAALINFAGEAKGVQVAVVNIAAKMHGCQISGSCGYMVVGTGAQFAGWANLADKFKGVQCGTLNIGGEVKGLQLGVLNVADTMSGCQIGLCNVIRNSALPILPVVNMSF